MNVQKTFLLFWTVATAIVLGCHSAGVAQDFPTGKAAETPLSPQATQFLRGITLMLLPHNFEDDDDWGAEKRIQSGLNVDLDGLNLKTSRRWKSVNHGTWRRVDAQLIDPKEHFQLGVSVLPRHDADVPRYRVTASIKLRVVGRQQQWSLGAMLYSISADATADVAMTADLEFRSQLINHDDRTKLQVLPHVETAKIQLTGYRLNEISRAKGSAVHELGRTIEPIVQRTVRKKSDQLPAKINGRIQEKPERFQIPASILSFLQKKEAAVTTGKAEAAKSD